MTLYRMNIMYVSTFNKMVNGELITVQFNVDDLKVSHKDRAVLDDFLVDLRSKFEQKDELTENKGVAHKYLGITTDYSIAGKVVFTMFNYLEEVIFEATDDLKKTFILSWKQSAVQG